MPKNLVSDDLLKILACPVTKEPLELSKDKKWLISKKSRLKYPIKDGIPVLLPQNSKKNDK